MATCIWHACLFKHICPRAPAQLATFGPTDWQQQVFRNQDTMSDAVGYMFDLAQYTLLNATDSSGATIIGDYSRLAFMRFTANLGERCSVVLID